MAQPWSDGLLLTFLGMGTVFCFLGMLIFSILLLSTLVKRIERDPLKKDELIAAVALAAFNAHNTR